MSVKLYYKNEIRRFPLGMAVDKQGSVSYDGLMAKIRSLYENLGPEKLASFNLYWKDSEHDFITIASNDDLNEALRSRSDDVLRAYLTDEDSDAGELVDMPPVTQVTVDVESVVDDVQSEAAAPPATNQERVTAEATNETSAPPPAAAAAVDESLHVHVTCDGCNGEVKGQRYKCVACPDYDLCYDCEQKHLHDQHPMLRISSPKDKTWKSFFNYTRVLNGGGRCPYAHRALGTPAVSQIIEQMHQCAVNRATVANEAVLSQVGSVVSHVLKSLGIDADYTVEPKPAADQQQKKEETKPTETEAGAAAAGGAPDSGDAQAQAQQVEKKQDEPAAEKKNKPEEAQAPQDWEMLDSVHVPLYPSVSTAPPAAGNDLDAAVKSSLEHMTAMGFTNEGGWLTSLLYQKKGDISAVLDALQPYNKSR